MDEILNPKIDTIDDRGNIFRPQNFDDYIGQELIKEKIRIFIEAAKKRNEPLDHVLLYGPPGLGKTTMAYLIAKEMGVDLKITSGPALEKSGDLAAILTNLNKGDILFIDEIHRLNRTVEEILYSAIEDFKLDIVIGKGPSARTIRLNISPFTLIGATTQSGKVSAPLRSRFGVLLRLDYYDLDSLKKIVLKLAYRLGIKITENGALEIARRGRGTPRIVGRILKRVRDYADIKGDGNITEDIARHAVDMLGIDNMGLDDLDRQVLNIIIRHYDGGPVGLDTIAVAIGEESENLYEVCEPYLIKIGFLKRTPRGRVATAMAYRHLGIKDSNPPSLFGD